LIRLLAAFLVPGLLLCLLAACGTDDAPRQSEIEIGRRIFRDGLLASGEPLAATVAGDVRILGTQFSCQSCHGRSGMGVPESTYIVPPITGPVLFSESPQPQRPAYTNASLARALREGVTPTGRQLAELMPRFEFDDAAIDSLAAYLATLSAGNSPGVDASEIHFATVTTEDVDPSRRSAMLAVLQQYFEEVNRQTRAESGRRDRGFTPESKLPPVFREWSLHEWVLRGPSESWGAQLETQYQQTPVFAMVSGIGTGSWMPVARFCEQHEIPCLLPATDLPDAGGGDFYTLYFSRGLGLEADLIASHIIANPVKNVIQVFCDDSTAQAAGILRQSLDNKGIEFENIRFDCRKTVQQSQLAERVSSDAPAAYVLWANTSQLGDLPELPGGRFYVSSILLQRDGQAVTAGITTPVFMVYPFRLPGSSDPALTRFSVWAKTRNIELVDARLQGEVFFVCLVLNDAVKHMGRFFVRDYLLDMLDHSQALVAYLPFYPRPTIGPGQRFLSKGGYILPVVNGTIQSDDAQWILP